VKVFSAANNHALQTSGKTEVKFRSLLTSSLKGKEWSVVGLSVELQMALTSTVILAFSFRRDL
jgi:hypothetical protein